MMEYIDRVLSDTVAERNVLGWWLGDSGKTVPNFGPNRTSATMTVTELAIHGLGLSWRLSLSSLTQGNRSLEFQTCG